ncbi:MAG: RluA family pseudouridine synthase [Eubacteriales bacterium]|nr:RluA family pseudouridine synthase [Eubacteriales bacterium]
MTCVASPCGDIRILYEDNHLLVVVKPCNLLTQGDITGDADLLTLLKGYIRRAYHKPGEVYLGLVHRLDRPTGGVLVFARTSKAAARLSAQVREGRLHKEYLCVCRGAPPGGSLRSFLRKDEATNMVTAVPQGTPGAKEARLHHEVLAVRDGLALCAVRLETGRSHQIRVQFAQMGHPLWGDARYDPSSHPGQLALWSWRLGLEHPTKKKPMTFACLPQGGVWDTFAKEDYDGCFTGHPDAQEYPGIH